MNPQTQIDKDVQNLVKAMGQVETGTSSPDAYTKRGASGEYGRYQFMPDTWNMWAAESGITTPLEQSSIEEQNKVAYNKVKQWKDQGLTPAQIASKWNSGDENAYKQTHIGVNNQGVAYNTPEHVRKVSQEYQKIKGGGNIAYATTGSQSPEQKELSDSMLANASQGVADLSKETLGQQLGGRALDISEALSKTAEGQLGGNLVTNVGSGALQSVGALAGGIGDVSSAALRLIPGVEKVEEWIAKGVEKGLDTETGQKLVQDYANFAQAHPVAADNIAAIGNIAGVIPLFKGISMAGKAALEGTENLFINRIKESARQELQDAAGRDITGRRILKNIEGRELDSIDQIINNGFVPDVVEDANGIPRYSSAFAVSKIDDALDLDEQRLQDMLETASEQGLAGYVPLKQMQETAIAEITKELKGSPDFKKAIKQINSDFDNYQAQYGDLITLSELNDIKRMARKSVNFNSPLLEQSVRYHEGQAIMRMIEDVAERRGMKDVRKINREMASKIEAQKLLEKIDKKSVPNNPGWRDLTMRKGGDVSTIAGEAIGQSMGIPGVGAFIGKYGANKMIRGNKGSLQRLAKNRGKRKLSKVGTLAPLLPVIQGSKQEYQEQRETQ